MDPEAPNVLHTHSHHATWSRANEKGVFPGVATPLNWSIWGEIGERSVRHAAYDLGLMSEHELALPDDVDDWMWSIFYGRPAANVDGWRRLYDRGLAGAGAGEAAERQVFGGASAGRSHSAPSDRRAEVARKRPRMLSETPGRMRRLREQTAAFWREVTGHDPLATPERARSVFREALFHFERADRCHIAVSLLATEAVTEISSAALRAGLPDAANALMIGYPGMEEFETAIALWDLSRNRLSLEDFLGSHGFHGSQEGEIASHSWRERPDPVLALARRYERLGEADDPREREARAIEKRERLEAELRRALPDDERDGFSQALERASVFLPLREAGRATLTLALDAMRAATRRLGSRLGDQGRLLAADDAFLLTRDELLDPPSDVQEIVESRRRLRATYSGFELPETWQGMPEKQATPSEGVELGQAHAPRLLRGTRIEGLGASAGVHDGTARVVLDPSNLDDDFAAGDVLVAPATDPSWAPLFLLAGAVVIDTGSNISHAAVVAREMGIPAVVSAPEASRRIRSGQRVRVDGSQGTIEILA
jgi:pyruvate,water dikinase